jgi:hypothetical protein
VVGGRGQGLGVGRGRVGLLQRGCSMACQHRHRQEGATTVGAPAWATVGDRGRHETIGRDVWAHVTRSPRCMPPGCIIFMGAPPPEPWPTMPPVLGKAWPLGNWPYANDGFDCCSGACGSALCGCEGKPPNAGCWLVKVW